MCKPFWSPLYKSATKIASVATSLDVKTMYELVNQESVKVVAL